MRIVLKGMSIVDVFGDLGTGGLGRVLGSGRHHKY